MSPLLICLCVAPLSHEPRMKEKGFIESEYQLSPITHLMFMDDLKVYEQSKSQLDNTVRVVEKVSEALGMTEVCGGPRGGR